MKLVITMSRRFGTGASIIAEDLALFSDDAPQIF